MDKFYVTTPIYYVNSTPHIGHAYTMIAADVLARYHRLKGQEVFFLTGTDEHGAKVAQSAQEANQDPQAFTDEMSARFEEAWDALNISHNLFYRTTSDQHKKGVLKFIQILKDQGDIYEDKYVGLYCVGCEKFITEKELVNGQCPDHKIEPEKITEKNYFFKLDKYLNKVKNKIERDEINILPASAKKEVLGLFQQKLENFSISREKVKWGIKIPFDESQVFYVWVEALQNYITALGFAGEEKNFKKYWPVDLHLIGKDILKFHAIYWPALLLAAGLKLPQNIYVHGFFTIDGQKMSKSVGNVIDPNDLVKKFGSDGARYLILAQFPFGADGDIKAEKFEEQYIAELANNLGNLVSRVVKLAQGIKKQKTYNKELKAKIEESWNKYQNEMEKFRIDSALGVVKSLINYLNKHIDETKPWELRKKNQQDFEITMQGLTECLRHIAWMIYPYLPETADKILKQLGVLEDEKAMKFKELTKWKLLDMFQIKTGEILFPKNT